MKRGFIWIVLTFLMVISLVLASCAKSSATSTSTTSTTSSTSTTPTLTTTSTTTSAVVTTTATTTTAGNWWDSLGTPTYGGTLVGRSTSTVTQWDPLLGASPIYFGTLWNANYLINPAVWDFTISFRPPEYADGYMLTSYEMPDLTTVIAHLRQDIYWQNIAPANGRQFVAADVVYHYDRMLGLGDGFTTVAPYYASSTIWHSLISVTATDKFTVVWKWVPNTSPLLILTQMQLVVCDNSLECPEAVQQWGNLNDWHHAIGTGPYILTDFVDSSSVTYVKNPNFWYYDKRWPQDKLPYIDTIKTLIIASSMTAEAALRTGKIDYMGVSAIDARSIAKTNPEIVQKPLPANSETSVDPRNDLAPFNDVRVRTALQEAINIPLISQTYYLGTSTPWPSSLTENLMGIGGWGYPYPDWPQTLKDEYAYNPTNAKALLTAAGFPNGFTTTLVLESDADQDLFQIVRSEFADIGVTVNTQLMDVATWQSWVLNGRKQTALASRGGMIGVNSSPFSELARFTTGYQLNYICVSDPKIDAWYAQATTASDVNTVKQILHDENLYIAQQHIVISVAQPTSYNLVQPWVKGCAGPNALGQGPISGFVGSWGAGNWIDLDLKKSLGH